MGKRVQVSSLLASLYSNYLGSFNNQSEKRRIMKVHGTIYGGLLTCVFHYLNSVCRWFVITAAPEDASDRVLEWCLALKESSCFSPHLFSLLIDLYAKQETMQQDAKEVRICIDTGVRTN
jgi:hypothetical protein